jgi:hypothetical protein
VHLDEWFTVGALVHPDACEIRIYYRILFRDLVYQALVD